MTIYISNELCWWTQSNVFFGKHGAKLSVKNKKQHAKLINTYQHITLVNVENKKK